MSIDDPNEKISEAVTAADEEQQQVRADTPNAPSMFDAQTMDFSFGPQISPLELPCQLGNYTLIEKVGQGGAGIVFRATSVSEPADSAGTFAVKVLRPEISIGETSLKRFSKEARLHGEIDSPYVTRLLEFNSHNGLYFMVSEFVEGVSLRSICETYGPLPVKFSLHVIRDLLRALAALHSNNVLHRDVKPENMLAMFDGPAADAPQLDHLKQVKLTDFGLARHIEQSESMAMTKQHAILGTPLYMAPEQHLESRKVDARADIYSVGATLFHFLAGRPPFETKDAVSMARMHREQQAEKLTAVVAGIGEGLSNVVAKALEKQPELRYCDANEMLADVERLLTGKPTSIRPLPALPAANQTNVKQYEFEWELDASVAALWPLVADTDRFNRAIGLPAPEFSYSVDGGERRIDAKTSFNGLKVQWREHPFEWIREKNMSVLREFSSGPFEWVTSTVELAPLIANRTRLIHRFAVKPRGLLGWLMTPLQFRVMTKRSLDRVYERLQSIANDQSCGYACHAPFGKPVSLNRAQVQRLDQRIEQLGQQLNRELAEALAMFLTTVGDSKAARIRPLALNKEIGCSKEQALELCMQAVTGGVLNISWDILCPVCRIASNNISSIQKIDSHASCEACNLEFEVDFAESVELIFSVHPEIRSVDLATYCIGGPFHLPHVLAQNRLCPGEYAEVGGNYFAGSYQVRGPQLDAVWPLQVNSTATSTTAEIDLAKPTDSSVLLAAGLASVRLTNNTDSDVLTRLEQKADRVDAFTAADAARHVLFKQLFPDEVVSAPDLVELATFHLLAVWDGDSARTVEELGDLKMRSTWNSIEQDLTGDSPPTGRVIDSSHDSLVLAYQQQTDLCDAVANFFNQTCSQLDLDPQRFSIAIHKGGLMFGGDSGNASMFGPPLREIKAVMSRFSMEPAVMLISWGERDSEHLQALIQNLSSDQEAFHLKDSEFLKRNLSTK